MKKHVLFLILLCTMICSIELHSCEDIYKQSQNINFNQSIENKLPNNTIHTYNTKWNGYRKDECDKGTCLYDEYYYKWVFETKKHGIFVTKHAIPCYKEFPKQCNDLFFNKRKNFRLMKKELQTTLGNELNEFIDSYTIEPFLCDMIHLKLSPRIKKLKANEYSLYKTNHPGIKILAY